MFVLNLVSCYDETLAAGFTLVVIFGKIFHKKTFTKDNAPLMTKM